MKQCHYQDFYQCFSTLVIHKTLLPACPSSQTVSSPLLSSCHLVPVGAGEILHEASDLDMYDDAFIEHVLSSGDAEEYC